MKNIAITVPWMSDQIIWMDDRRNPEQQCTVHLPLESKAFCQGIPMVVSWVSDEQCFVIKAFLF